MGHSTGWRALAPRPIDDARLDSIEKDHLFKAARDASQALALPVSTRALLNQLVGFFGEIIAGRAIVWPSNAVLVERTGLSERQVRYSIRELIVAVVLGSKDSANGKRYAVRSRSGQILDAFGLDLTPMLGRWEEFKTALELKRSQKAADKRLREEVTITRRMCVEALSEHPRGQDLHDSVNSRMNELTRRPAAAAIEDWRALKAELLLDYYPSANGGSDCRHKETNNDASDQSCHKGHEQDGVGVDLGGLLRACGRALSYASEPIRNTRELVEVAAKIRGVIGAHRSAWDEACVALGRIQAAAAVFVVAEIYDRDVTSGAGRIRNPGGYFRAFVRMIREGRITLADEIIKLKGSRA